MKAVKTIGIVVGVVALAATGVGAALGGLAAGAAAAGGTAALGATLVTIGTIASIAGGVLSLGVGLFGPKPKFSQQGNPLQFQTNPQSGLPYCIGRTRMSGVRIHADTYDATAYKSEGKDDVLAFAVLLSAGGAVEGPLTFRADKEVVTFNGTTGMAIGKYADWMAQKVSLGLAGASALALAFGGGNFPGWTANHKLSGIAHALWDLRFDPKGNMFGAGVPEPEWVGKWVKVYDPRKDSTYPGGSGAHRALNEATYEWSANPALHALTWALGRWQNGKRTLGIGAPVANIRVADFVEAANVADANAWKCGGVEWSTDSKWSVMKRMLQAGGAEPTMTGAMIGCRVNTPRVSIATVTAAKLLDGASFPSTRSRRDRFNTVIPRYRSEDHDWEIISGAPIQVAAYVAADGSPRTKEIDFPLVQHETGGNGNTQAGQLATYEIVNSREAGPWRFTVGPEYVGVKTGDVITLDVPDEGIAAQPVLIRSRSIDPATFKITFECETETTAKHAFALGKTAVPPPTYAPTPPDLTPPTPSAALWSLNTGSALGGLVPAILVTGACEFPGADTVVIEYRAVGATDWQSRGSFDAGSPIDHAISPVEAETDYEARVAYKSGNRIGGWLVLSPVTTAAISETQLAKQVRVTPEFASVPATMAGAITSYTSAQGDFVVEQLDGTDVSANFTLSTESNPASLTVNYTGQHFDISGGFILSESPASLTIKATGSGDYVGLIFRRTFTLFANPTGVMLQQLQSANDDNNTTPTNDIVISNVRNQATATPALAHPDGRVTYLADVTWTYNSNPKHANNFDDLVLIRNSAATNAAVTLGGLNAPGANERGGRLLLDVTTGSATIEILSKDDPTKWYTIGLQKFRKVAPGTDPKGFKVGAITQHGPFRPGATQVALPTLKIDGTDGFAPVLSGTDLILPIYRTQVSGLPLVNPVNRRVQLKRHKGATDVTSSTTWAISASHNCSASIDAAGLMTITGSNLGQVIGGNRGNAYVQITGTYEGVVQRYLVGFETELTQPVLIDVTGARPAISANPSGIAGLSISAGYVGLSDTLTFTTGSNGSFRLMAAYDYASPGADNFVPDFLYQIKLSSSGTWNDGFTWSGTGVDYDPIYMRKRTVIFSNDITGLTANTSYDLRIQVKRNASCTAAFGDVEGKALWAQGY